MGNKVLIDIMNKNNFDAGTKARNDAAKILNEQGFQSNVMFNRTHNNIQRTLELLLALRGIRKKADKGDIFVLQYPYQPKVVRVVLKQSEELRKKKNIKILILIHDIIYLRNESYVNKSVKKMRELEVSFFNRCDAVIVHNAAMKKQLITDGVTVPMIELGIFDYIYHDTSASNDDHDKIEVVFAGNLSPEKSGFIYKYKQQTEVSFNLYGSKPSDLNSSFTYKGSYPPDQLIENLSGNYGLVWDGPDDTTCTGNYGEYLKYNNPHKCSLYIAAELPVIVWNESALAPFVLKNNIGCCISNLDEIKNLPRVHSEEYQTMLGNVKKWSFKLRNGNMLCAAINRVKEELEQDICKGRSL